MITLSANSKKTIKTLSALYKNHKVGMRENLEALPYKVQIDNDQVGWIQFFKILTSLGYYQQLRQKCKSIRKKHIYRWY